MVVHGWGGGHGGRVDKKGHLFVDDVWKESRVW